MLVPNQDDSRLFSPWSTHDETAPQNGRQFNLDTKALEYLRVIGVNGIQEVILYSTLSILHSPAYKEQNAGPLGQDWPRIPLPAEKERLLASAEMGRRLADLLDPEKPVKGITSGALRPEMKTIAVISRVDDQPLKPAAGELKLTAGWGHGGKGGITMPGQGRIVSRAYTPDELAAIEAGASAAGLTLEQALRHLGEDTRDVYLNGVAYWKNLPARVWSYTIGGYQVIKKWLSYREHDLLGRSLTVEEVHEVGDMARRIAAILLMEPELDANYQATKEATYPWPGSTTSSKGPAALVDLAGSEALQGTLVLE